VKSMKQGSFQIPKNLKYNSIIEKPRCSHELANNVNGIGDVWLSDSEVNKTPN
jgi:hypothetical protein